MFRERIEMMRTRGLVLTPTPLMVGLYVVVLMIRTAAYGKGQERSAAHQQGDDSKYII